MDPIDSHNLANKRGTFESHVQAREDLWMAAAEADEQNRPQLAARFRKMADEHDEMANLLR